MCPSTLVHTEPQRRARLGNGGHYMADSPLCHGPEIGSSLSVVLVGLRQKLEGKLFDLVLREWLCRGKSRFPILPLQHRDVAEPRNQAWAKNELQRLGNSSTLQRLGHSSTSFRYAVINFMSLFEIMSKSVWLSSGISLSCGARWPQNGNASSAPPDSATISVCVAFAQQRLFQPRSSMTRLTSQYNS